MAFNDDLIFKLFKVIVFDSIYVEIFACFPGQEEARCNCNIAQVNIEFRVHENIFFAFQN
jgi:hypothetical protein